MTYFGQQILFLVSQNVNDHLPYALSLKLGISLSPLNHIQEQTCDLFQQKQEQEGLIGAIVQLNSWGQIMQQSSQSG